MTTAIQYSYLRFFKLQIDALFLNKIQKGEFFAMSQIIEDFVCFFCTYYQHEFF